MKDMKDWHEGHEGLTWRSLGRQRPWASLSFQAPTGLGWHNDLSGNRWRWTNKNFSCTRCSKDLSRDSNPDSLAIFVTRYLLVQNGKKISRKTLASVAIWLRVYHINLQNPSLNISSWKYGKIIYVNCMARSVYTHRPHIYIPLNYL